MKEMIVFLAELELKRAPKVFSGHFFVFRFFKDRKILADNMLHPLTTNVSHHIETSQLICIALQINWLVSIRWGKFVVNGLTLHYRKIYVFHHISLFF